MTLSSIGAAVTLGNIESIFSWLCQGQRPIEIQDFTSPNLLGGIPVEIVIAYQGMLKPHKGVRGMHGPFFGLDLGNLEKEFQKLIYWFAMLYWHLKILLNQNLRSFF